tara:strand:- start:1126 stop:1368 length:243 start_codon:yes stop_codon:yes gene_type:complete
MSKTHTESFDSFVENYPTNDHQVQFLIHQATLQRHGRMVDDGISLVRGLVKAVSYILTLELPLFLSPTLKAPSMVAVKNG